MNVIDMIFFWAKIDPHRAAIIQPEMVTTFQGLADAIELVSERIDRLGLDQREPIAVSIANPSYFAAAAFSVLRCGYTLALVNPPLFPQLQPSGIRNLIYDTQGLVLSGGRNIRFEASWLPTGASPQRKSYRARPLNDVSTIAFTSGTTGLPKMHVMRRAALEQRFACPITSLATGSHQKAMIMPGIAGGFGFNRACEMLFAGKTACFAPSSEEALWLIGTFGIETIMASPQQALGLAEIQEMKTRLPLTSVQTLRIGGAAVPPNMARRLRNHVCRNIIIYYASTEAGTAASAPYDGIETIPDAVGFLGPDVELEIVDEADIALPIGSEGLVRLRTPQMRLNIAPGDPEPPPDSKASWFYPGDVGRLNEDRVLCVTGRSSDVINSGGVKISAAKIEEIVQSLPEVREAAACGIVGLSGIEELWLALVATGPVDPEAITRQLRDKQVGVVPSQVLMVDALPRGDLGKLQRYRLKEQLLSLKNRG
jgi:acyl-CoA synthetase (AMP-forming)/AMP-acid ligase II